MPKKEKSLINNLALYLKKLEKINPIEKIINYITD